MKSKKQPHTVTLDEDIVLEIKALAEADDRSFSHYVNMILKKYLEESKKSPRTYDGDS